MSMAELLYGLHLASTSAVFRVSRESVEKAIYVLDGRPVSVDSDLRSETLGAYLVRAGRLSEEDHRLVIEKMRQTGRRQGELLIEAGILGPHELYDALTEHQSEKIISCFGWQDGDFSIAEGRGWATSVLNLPMEPLSIVLEGVAQYHQAGRLEPPMGLPEGARPYARPALAKAASRLGLGPREARIQRAMERGESLGAIVLREGGEREQVARLLHALYLMEMVGFDLRVAAPKPKPKPKAEAKRKPAPTTSATAHRPRAPARGGPAATIMEDYLRLKDADHYAILGLEPGSSPTKESVERAFADRARRYRPEGLETVSQLVQDKAAELLQKLAEARDLLTDPSSRTTSEEGDASSGEPVRPRSRPLESEILFGQAQAALADGEPWFAAGKLREALALKKGEPQFEALLGWALYLSDPTANRKKAEGRLEAARQAHPGLPEPYLFMARLFEYDGEGKRALELYQQAASVAKGDLDIGREAHLFAIRLRKGKLRKQPSPAKSEASQDNLNQDVGDIVRRLLGKS